MIWPASVKDFGPDRRPGADRVARNATLWSGFHCNIMSESCGNRFDRFCQQSLSYSNDLDSSGNQIWTINCSAFAVFKSKNCGGFWQ